jgi:hypothetical protein
MGPAWLARERSRVRIIATAVAAVVFLLAGYAIDLRAWPEGDPARNWLFLGSLAGAIAVGALLVLVAGIARERPAALAIWWLLNAWERDWRALDGSAAPASPDEGLRRLGTREDDLALEMRATLLASAGRSEDADATVAAWKPSSPAGTAARDRLALRLAPDTTDAPLDAALASASALSDAAAVTAARARVLVADAQRRASLGLGYSVTRLIRARRVLGRHVDALAPVRRDQRDRAFRRWLLISLGIVGVPSAIAAAAFAQAIAG